MSFDPDSGEWKELIQLRREKGLPWWSHERIWVLVGHDSELFLNTDSVESYELSLKLVEWAV